MTKVKICGLKRIEDIDYVNELLPDYIGFVFAGSKRKVNIGLAKELSNKLKPAIKKVGVFVNEDVQKVKEISREVKLDILQFHGEENENYFRQFENIEIWKSEAIEIGSKHIAENFIEKINNYSVAAVVLDSSIKGQTGGTGKAFDWNIINKLELDKKLILAGGLNIENVEMAVKLVKPYAVDVSSGVETEGVKDFNKIKKFIEKVRNIK